MYAVIDTETTGVNLNTDRIIELAIIALDEDGNKQWEWCSLINPGRDTGGGLVRRIHQIYPRDVSNAPTFDEFAGHIADILDVRVLIAHNARFDLGMLGSEFNRLGVKIPPIMQICTIDLARECGLPHGGLEECCSALGIELEGIHHALADARATLCLAQKLIDFSQDELQNEVREQLREQKPWPKLPIKNQRPITRPIFPHRKSDSVSHRSINNNVTDSVHYYDVQSTLPAIETFSINHDTPESKYLAAVEWVLEDRIISPEQQQALIDLQDEFSLDNNKAYEIHMTFIRGLAGSMLSDGKISNHEKFDLELVGKALKLSNEDVMYALQNPIGLNLINADYKLKPGTRVVFTGEMSLPRSEWIARTKSAGLRVTGSVSSKTDYLVVPFGETGSRKSLKARKLGVRVISEQRFLRMIKHLESCGS